MDKRIRPNHTSPEELPATCPVCGEIVREANDKCPNCGQLLDWSDKGED